MNDTLSTVLVGIFLFGGLALALLKRKWEYALIGLYLIFALAIIETADSFGWIVLLEAIGAVGFYGFYVVLRWLDNKVFELRNK